MEDGERLETDVLIVGAGPAGLAAAIRLKQRSPALSVMVIEKGSEVGAHILSGAVIDPAGLDALLPDWRAEADGWSVPVTRERLLILGPAGAVRIPQALLPPMMKSRGHRAGSLADLCRWLARRAEALGVDIFPGFAGADLLLEGASVAGVLTGEMGRGRNGLPKANYAPGMEIRAKYTLLAEGARGSLSRKAIERFGLDRGSDPQKFGLGLKELWRVRPEAHEPGLVQHAFGWPLDNRTGGGSFVYHLRDGLVAVGLVVHLDYRNPFLSPFGEFQRLKTHPGIAALLAGGEPVAYGARVLTEGGWQSVPKLTFPGGALLGCAAGFMNVPRIRGSHNAILSGIAAGDAAAEAIASGRAGDELTAYEAGWRSGPIGRDLRPARNVKPLWSRFGTRAAIALGGADLWTNALGLSTFGTLHHRRPDHRAMETAARSQPVLYPPPDGTLTFDRATAIFLSNVAHDHDQPSHLKVLDDDLQRRFELGEFGGPSTRYCPAAVYDWAGTAEAPRFVVNAQNCIHCKTCDLKDPNLNILWTPPEGGGGPNYGSM